MLWTFFLLAGCTELYREDEEASDITETAGHLEGSITLEEVRQREERKFGATLVDPSSAAH